MKFDTSDVETGIEKGLERFRAEYPSASTANAESYFKAKGKSKINDILSGWPEDCHPRFVRTYAELHSLAVTVRAHQMEPELTDDDMRSALGFLSWWLNSFKHQ